MAFAVSMTCSLNLNVTNFFHPSYLAFEERLKDINELCLPNRTDLSHNLTPFQDSYDSGIPKVSFKMLRSNAYRAVS